MTSLRTIQALRAVAALLVVLLHCLEAWAMHVDANAFGTAWTNGAAGVDIFFVISGFIMTVSSRHLAGSMLGWWIFLKNRITRIVPLYWLLTTVKLIVVVVAGDLALRTHLSSDFILSSYLFLPALDAAGHFRPLLAVGWTLTFEFFFYGLFAVALALRVDPLRFLLPALLMVATGSLFRSSLLPTWALLADPIVLEFLFGIVVGKLVLSGYRLTSRSAAVALFASFACLLVIEPWTDQFRFLAWGLPAAMIVFSAISLEREYGHLIPKFVLKLGNASYSLYLSHGFVVAFVSAAAGAMGMTGSMAQFGSTIVAVLGSCIAARLLYEVVEKPLILAIKKAPHATGDVVMDNR
jgi:exopolysaccharide production protein ExoZ